MKDLNGLKIFLAGLIIIISSCATQNSGSVETDDVYYSSEDRGHDRRQKTGEEQKAIKVKETAPVKSGNNNYNFDSKP